MKRIIYTRPDGGLSVVTPVINTHTLVNGVVVPVREDVSEEEALERAIAKLPNFAKKDFQIVDSSEIPTDRTYRNAWKAAVGRVDHDMEKCREIHKDRLRALRAPKLLTLDVEYMKADEAGDSAKKAEIAGKKQALRDTTKHPGIAAAVSVEELKLAIPDGLMEGRGNGGMD